MFYAYQPLQRSGQFNAVLRVGRLIPQYVVDQYCTVDSNCLTYLQSNQRKLRVSDYYALCELLRNCGNIEDETDTVRVGYLFISPSSHVCGDSYMRQNMHNIIAVSNTFGYPDIFMTTKYHPR